MFFNYLHSSSQGENRTFHPKFKTKPKARGNNIKSQFEEKPKVEVNTDELKIEIIMTYTTPSCPEWELIQQMIKNAISDKLPTYDTNIEITFDPQRSLDMIKDQDLRRMFE